MKFLAHHLLPMVALTRGPVLRDRTVDLVGQCFGPQQRRTRLSIKLFQSASGSVPERPSNSRNYSDGLRRSDGQEPDLPQLASLPVVPPRSLKKEYKRALDVLGQMWRTQRPMLDEGFFHAAEQRQNMLPTGFMAFLNVPISRKLLYRDSTWTWNQSHTKVRTYLGSTPVVLAKFSPRRLNSDTSQPLPPFKVWYVTVLHETPFFFLWVERGAAARFAAPPRRMSAPTDSLTLENISFLAQWLDDPSDFFPARSGSI